MKRFDGKCPACGSRDVKMLYAAKENVLTCLCGRCYREWLAAPLDAPDVAATVPQPEADAEQVICDSADYICHIRECEHREPHTCNRLLLCAYKYEASCTPVPQPEAQPEPPLPMKPAQWPGLRTGETNCGALFLRRSACNSQYFVRNEGDTGFPYAPWSDWLALARWIVAQEEARHALPR